VARASGCGGAVRANSSFKEFSVSPSGYENNQILAVIYRVDKQKITTDMTLSMIFPITRKLVVFQFGRQRPIVSDDQTRDFLQ
jgi:hypothetical protein